MIYEAETLQVYNVNNSLYITLNLFFPNVMTLGLEFGLVLLSCVSCKT